MPEPMTTAGTYLGIKVSPAIAGVLGAMVTMRAVPNLRWYERIISMVNGSAAAAYLAPAATRLISEAPSHELENAVAFLFGVVALNVVAGLFEMSRRFADDPLSTLSNIVKAKNGDSLDKTKDSGEN